MASLKLVTKSIGLTATPTTNLFNPPTTTGGTNGGSSSQYVVVRQIHFSNNGSSARTVSLWRGLTAANTAGTELISAKALAAHDTLTLNVAWRFDAADFLVGGQDAGTDVTMTLTYEVGVAG